MQLMIPHRDANASQMRVPGLELRLRRGPVVFDGNIAEAIAFAQTPVRTFAKIDQEQKQTRSNRKEDITTPFFHKLFSKQQPTQWRICDDFAQKHVLQTVCVWVLEHVL